MYFLQRLTFLIRLRTVNMIERKRKKKELNLSLDVRYHHRTRTLINNNFISIDIKLTCYWIISDSFIALPSQFLYCAQITMQEKKNILSRDDVYLGYNIRFQRKKISSSTHIKFYLLCNIQHSILWYLYIYIYNKYRLYIYYLYRVQSSNNFSCSIWLS